MRRSTAAMAGISAIVLVPVHATSAGAAGVCDSLTQPIYQRVKPATDGSLLTPWIAEATNAGTKFGFTVDNGVAFSAATRAATGLVAVNRVYNARTGDFHNVRKGQVATWVAKGYADQGTRFYAMATANGCGVGVRTFAKGSMNRQAATTAAIAELRAAGWTDQGIAYYAATTAPSGPDADGKFAVAVIPDTQTEVFGTDQRFPDRTTWLVNNRTSLDLRFVAHTGDVVNWGWLMPSQYQIASDAAAVLDAAKLPYAFTIGNHDTRAVGHDGIPGSRGYGGSAYVNNPECLERLGPTECNTLRLVRRTEEFNAVFPLSRYRNVSGTYAAGQVDNIYSTFEAAGKKWLVLTLELWARPEVITWAKSVVAANPDRNVLVQTHSYLNGDGSISTSNGGYGATSPKYLFDNLIKVYPNIKAVFSGHAGTFAQRVDTGANGNRIVSLLGNYESSMKNPVRLVEFDVTGKSLKSWVYDPDNARVAVAASTITGMSYVG